MTIRVLTVFGTRPEAIKLAPVIRALDRDRRFTSRTCSTGQHREMLAQVLEAFDLVPDVALAAMRPGQGQAGLAARVSNPNKAQAAPAPRPRTCRRFNVTGGLRRPGGADATGARCGA